MKERISSRRLAPVLICSPAEAISSDYHLKMPKAAHTTMNTTRGGGGGGGSTVSLLGQAETPTVPVLPANDRHVAEARRRGRAHTLSPLQTQPFPADEQGSPV